MSQSLSSYQRQLFVLYLIAILVAGKVIQPCFDPDTWWHLAVARYIVDERRLPSEDPFSQIGIEQHSPWVAYSWLFELNLYALFQAFGTAGVFAFRYFLVMLSWGGIAWLLLGHARNKWRALLLLALISISLRPFSAERSWHISIFFTTVTLHAVGRVLNGVSWKRFWWLPLLYVLWANIHIQFVMGFAVLGLAWLSAVVDGCLRKDREQMAIAKQLFFLGLVSSLATLATPFHYRLYGVIVEYATQTKTLALINELKTPPFFESVDNWFNWPLIVLTIWACVTTAIRGFRAWDVLLLASAIFFGLRMQRDLWYGVLAASVVIIHERNWNPEKEPNSKFSAGIIAAMAIAASFLVCAAWEFGLSRGKTAAQTHDETYPVKAAQYVREHRPAGPLLNNFDWGGYLIWALPEYPVSIDGRTNLYGEQRMIRSFNAWSDGETWKDYPDLLHAGVIIAPKIHAGTFKLTTILRQHPDRWRIVYEDDTAVVYVPVQ